MNDATACTKIAGRLVRNSVEIRIAKPDQIAYTQRSVQEQVHDDDCAGR